MVFCGFEGDLPPSMRRSENQKRRLKTNTWKPSPPPPQLKQAKVTLQRGRKTRRRTKDRRTARQGQDKDSGAPIANRISAWGPTSDTMSYTINYAKPSADPEARKQFDHAQFLAQAPMYEVLQFGQGVTRTTDQKGSGSEALPSEFTSSHTRGPTKRAAWLEPYLNTPSAALRQIRAETPNSGYWSKLYAPGDPDSGAQGHPGFGWECLRPSVAVQSAAQSKAVVRAQMQAQAGKTSSHSRSRSRGRGRARRQHPSTTVGGGSVSTRTTELYKHGAVYQQNKDQTEKKMAWRLTKQFDPPKLDPRTMKDSVDRLFQGGRCVGSRNQEEHKTRGKAKKERKSKPKGKGKPKQPDDNGRKAKKEAVPEKDDDEDDYAGYSDEDEQEEEEEEAEESYGDDEFDAGSPRASGSGSGSSAPAAKVAKASTGTDKGPATDGAESDDYDDDDAYDDDNDNDYQNDGKDEDDDDYADDFEDSAAKPKTPKTSSGNQKQKKQKKQKPKADTSTKPKQMQKPKQAKAWRRGASGIGSRLQSQEKEQEKEQKKEQELNGSHTLSEDGMSGLGASSDSVTLAAQASHVHTANDGKSYTLFSADKIADTLINTNSKDETVEAAGPPANANANANASSNVNANANANGAGKAAIDKDAADASDDDYNDDDEEADSTMGSDSFEVDTTLDEQAIKIKNQKGRKSKPISRLTTLVNSNRRNSAEFKEFASKAVVGDQVAHEDDDGA